MPLMRSAGKPTTTPTTPATSAAERQRDRERQAEFLRQHRRGVGADRHEAGLAERDLAGLERRKEAIGGNDVDAG